MALNSSHAEVVRKRQELVARYRCRHMPITKIVEVLASDDDIEVCRQTVATDIKALRARWRENADRDIAEHCAEQLKRLTEACGVAWEMFRDALDGEDKGRALNLVLKAEAAVAKLLGTNAPEKRDITGTIDMHAYPGEDLTHYPQHVLDQMEAWRLEYGSGPPAGQKLLEDGDNGGGSEA